MNEVGRKATGGATGIAPLARPRIDPTAFVAPGASVVGDVEIGPETSVWYGCVLRGDLNRITIGARTNIQDGTIVHVEPGKPRTPDGFSTTIGHEVLIGHASIIHGCHLHDRAFVGMGAIIMDGCVIEAEGMLAAGALLTQGRRIRTGELWAGRPAKFLRQVTSEETADMARAIRRYVELGKQHAQHVVGI